MSVLIGVAVSGWPNLGVTAKMRIERDILIEYRRKGFEINRTYSTASKGDLTYKFIDADKEQEWRGCIFNDVIGDFTQFHLSRIIRTSEKN